MIEAGKPFPDFSLPNQDGKTVKLSDFAGKWLVVYFYPKDDTPGCTIQGKSFTASKPDFEGAGSASSELVRMTWLRTRASAISSDSRSTSWPTPRLNCSQPPAVGQSEYKGTKYWDRTSFVIGPDGVVRNVYEKVDPNGHEQKLLEDIKQLQTK